MSHAIEDFVGRRVELLATVFLTARPDVEVFPFELADQVSLMARIISPDDRHPHERLFGIISKGSAKAVRTEVEANRLFNKDRGPTRQFPFPVLAIAFGMVGDDGYYAWHSEPITSPEGVPSLVVHRTLAGKPAKREALDSIIEKIMAWYDRYYTIMTTID